MKSFTHLALVLSFASVPVLLWADAAATLKIKRKSLELENDSRAVWWLVLQKTDDPNPGTVETYRESYDDMVPDAAIGADKPRKIPASDGFFLVPVPEKNWKTRAGLQARPKFERDFLLTDDLGHRAVFTVTREGDPQDASFDSKRPTLTFKDKDGRDAQPPGSITLKSVDGVVTGLTIK